MTPLDVLSELLGRVGARRGAAVLVSGEELSQWPRDAVTAIKAQRLLVKSRPAKSAVCPGCEHECVMPVHARTEIDPPVFFTACDKRGDVNRVRIPVERLSQWQSSAELICGFVAANLGIRRSNKQGGNAGRREIGLAAGDKRRQMLCLQADGELFLIAGENKVPLAELIEYQDGEYSLDKAMIRQLVDTATTADPRYTPIEVKREARKLKTQTLHDSWKKDYRTLKKKHPGRTDKWCSLQIAKMDIGKGHSPETIRKNMK